MILKTTPSLTTHWSLQQTGAKIEGLRRSLAPHAQFSISG